MKQIEHTFYSRYLKRFLDIVCAAGAILLLWWLLALIAIAVRLKMGSPVLFRQARPGRIDLKTGKERIFYLYKFRSMSNERNEKGELLPAAERLNGFGKILRATSLDELPEMWNILKGDMSFVGPRPLLPSYFEYYNEQERRRHLVRPGLTGLAQVSGRNAVSWKKKFELDNQYVEHISLHLDIKIVLLTLKKVLSHEGIEFEKNHQPILEYFASRDEKASKNKEADWEETAEPALNCGVGERMQ